MSRLRRRDRQRRDDAFSLGEDGAALLIEHAREASRRHPRPPLTAAERLRYRRWWLEKSGLDVDELVSIVTALE